MVITGTSVDTLDNKLPLVKADGPHINAVGFLKEKIKTCSGSLKIKTKEDINSSQAFERITA